jgi:UDP-N-acetylmuramate: L-alanyl-gamma-D-glutamyl-meso-diaminopimelate ligase
MDKADVPVVFYSKHALEIKRMPELAPELVAQGFGRNDLQIFTNREHLLAFLDKQDYRNANLLMMSSGDYEGLDVNSLNKYL